MANVTLSSSLTTNSEALTYFSGQNGIHYYGVFQVFVPVDGDYILKSDSSIDTYAILYHENFYPNSLSVNEIVEDDDSGGNLQFQINIYLKSNTRYILLITTVTAQVTGSFRLLVSGLNQVNLREINSSSIIPTTTSTLGTYLEYHLYI